uniref:Macaca fascicularis brain cDNA clone: QmoA-10909, similar to human arrestin domain containing 4 (ARRDC4), mRNA, RefSeq: NM_183376.1 n=1 Tax=Macaca fascicularis TaxID=9541 RepID=I7GKM5_MACFA|nr:unnamed protein product [Macaca fascicularis]
MVTCSLAFPSICWLCELRASLDTWKGARDSCERDFELAEYFGFLHVLRV